MLTDTSFKDRLDSRIKAAYSAAKEKNPDLPAMTSIQVFKSVLYADGLPNIASIYAIAEILRCDILDIIPSTTSDNVSIESASISLSRFMANAADLVESSESIRVDFNFPHLVRLVCQGIEDPGMIKPMLSLSYPDEEWASTDPSLEMVAGNCIAYILRSLKKNQKQDGKSIEILAKGLLSGLRLR